MNCKSAAKEESFCREDMFWSGLQFAVTDQEELAREQAAAGERVHLHDGVWWRDLRYGFCHPCFSLREIDHREVRPLIMRSPAGYMHVAAAGSPVNSVCRLILRERMQQYSLQQVDKKKRNEVRAGLARLEVRPVTHLEDLIRDGYGVYVSCRERTAWGADKTRRSAYESWITRAFRRPKRMVLGAYRQGKLVAFMLPSVVYNVACISYIASHTDSLSAYPNDALYHAFLCIARQTPGIEIANFGPISSKATLDNFKLHYAHVRAMPSYMWINPALRLLVGHRMNQRYPWLGLATGASR
jgi:hypothetical protein